jgi:hypothetical protein
MFEDAAAELLCIGIWDAGEFPGTKICVAIARLIIQETLENKRAASRADHLHWEKQKAGGISATRL